MALDFDAIANAVAARYDASQLTAPSGYLTIRVATANPPNQMVPLPAVLVFTDSGDFAAGGGTRIGTANFIVRFYYNQGGLGDLARDEIALRKWLSVLIYQHNSALQLGGTVVKTVLKTWKLGQMTYAGQEYTGIEMNVEVVVSEGWVPSA